MDNPQQIDKQPDEIGENSDASVNVKSITNIYYDCLERIFGFLDLDSLLNVANTCKRLQIAAATYYGDVYGKHRVYIWAQRACRGFGIRHVDVHIEVFGSECCLPFLRCFGPKVLRLHVYYDYLNATDYNNYVNRYINQYCAKTLENIAFGYSWKFSIENFPNPFECVEEVSMMSAELKGQLPHFVNLFPNMRKLKIRHLFVEDNCAAVHFPNLEQLTIGFNPERGLTMKILMNLLHANPQLEKFQFDMIDGKGITVNELLDTISQNPSITKLRLWNEIYNTNINPVDLMRFASQRPHTVELDLPSHRIPPQDVINFIRQLKSLKILRFSFNDQADYDQLVSQLDSEWKHDREIFLGGIHVIKLKR